MLLPSKTNFDSMQGMLHAKSCDDMVARTCQNTCLGNCNAPISLVDYKL